MPPQFRASWESRLRFGRGRFVCNRVQEDAAAGRIRKLRLDLDDKTEALASIRGYLASLSPNDSRRSNALRAQEKYRGERASIADELTELEGLLFDVCSLKVR